MMAKKLKTVLTYVQDETGSMHHRREATISAFEYFDTLKQGEKLGDVEVVVWRSRPPGEERVRRCRRSSQVAKLKESNRPGGVTPSSSGPA